MSGIWRFFADSTADPDLFALLRAARREMQTGMLILDGPELMVENRSPCPAANSYNEVCLREAASAMVLNEFAKQCHLSVLAAVPLSRDTEHRTNHRPTLSDVRYHRRRSRTVYRSADINTYKAAASRRGMPRLFF
jgi:replicative DNA helicase